MIVIIDKVQNKGQVFDKSRGRGSKFQVPLHIKLLVSSTSISIQLPENTYFEEIYQS